jgi:hypothetical protein
MKKIIIFLILSLPVLSIAQFNFNFEPEAFPVTLENGYQPFEGWCSGICDPIPNLVDIDADGDLDILSGALYGGLALFMNNGTINVPNFDFTSLNILDSVIDWDRFNISPTLADIDNDGDLDALLGSVYGNIYFYENIGDSVNYNYEFITDYFDSIDVTWHAKPFLIDIDNDGDYDLFVGRGSDWPGNPNSGKISYYRNDGTPEEYDYTFVTDFLDSIDVGTLSAPVFYDIDKDGDYDMFIGCGEGTIWYYENIGTPEIFDFQYVTNNFAGIRLTGATYPVFADIDNDNDPDLFVSVSFRDTGTEEGDLYFYENTGDSLNYNYELVTNNYLFFDIGNRSAPAFADLNNDGLEEIYVGEMYGRIRKLENTGSQTEPEFTQIPGNWSDIDVWINSVPVFCDIDADGDSDMFLGKYTFYTPPGVEFWENTGTPTIPFFTYRYDLCTQGPLGNHDGTAPVLFDIDNDGDYDLFIGEMNGDDVMGHIIFFENQGTTTRPSFIFSTWTYQDITLDLYTSPTFCDIDSDGVYELFIGDETGRIAYFENTGTPDSAVFVLADSNFLDVSGDFYINQLHPRFCDIDNDGDYDFFLGNYNGGILFYRNVGTSVSPEFHREFGLNDYKLYQNYPNPFNSSTTITFSLPMESPVEIAVYDNLGRKVMTLIDGIQPTGLNRIEWNASGLSSGVYYISMEGLEINRQTRKVILIK